MVFAAPPPPPDRPRAVRHAASAAAPAGSPADRRDAGGGGAAVHGGRVRAPRHRRRQRVRHGGPPGEAQGPGACRGPEDAEWAAGLTGAATAPPAARAGVVPRLVRRADADDAVAQPGVGHQPAGGDAQPRAGRGLRPDAGATRRSACSAPAEPAAPRPQCCASDMMEFNVIGSGASSVARARPLPLSLARPHAGSRAATPTDTAPPSASAAAAAGAQGHPRAVPPVRGPEVHLGSGEGACMRRSAAAGGGPARMPSSLSLPRAQDKRAQLMNELRLLCDGSTQARRRSRRPPHSCSLAHPYAAAQSIRGVIRYVGTYYSPEARMRRAPAAVWWLPLGVATSLPTSLPSPRRRRRATPSTLRWSIWTRAAWRRW